MPKKIFISDERMLKLVTYAIQSGLIKNKNEYCERIGLQPTALIRIEKGEQSFTKEQIHSAMKLTGASADWIFGFTKEMMRIHGKSPVERLREIIFELG